MDVVELKLEYPYYHGFVRRIYIPRFVKNDVYEMAIKFGRLWEKYKDVGTLCIKWGDSDFCLKEENLRGEIVELTKEFYGATDVNIVGLMFEFRVGDIWYKVYGGQLLYVEYDDIVYTTSFEYGDVDAMIALWYVVDYFRNGGR